MYTTDLWNDWVSQELKNYAEVLDTKTKEKKKKYLKKGYLHFDERFWMPERIDEIQDLLRNKLSSYNPVTKKREKWSFSPFLKILLKTPRYRYQEKLGYHGLDTKVRPICFASHIDSLIFSFYALGLTRKYEDYIKRKGFDECVLAYRSDLGKCNIQFAKEVFDEVRSRQECVAIALDIKGYFDHIDHLLLKEKWTKVWGAILPPDQYRLFNMLTEYSYVVKSHILRHFKIKRRKRGEQEPSTLMEYIPGKRDFEKFRALRKSDLVVTNNKLDTKTGRKNGIPQGSALSALLSNIYLIDFDEMMHEKSKKDGFIYKRYCDDILIICDIKDADTLKEFTIDSINNEYYLTIQDKKVETTQFSKNLNGKIRAFNYKKLKANSITIDSSNEQEFYKSLQYLGFEFNGQDVFIRSSSLSRYFKKMKARVVKTVSMAYGDKGKSDRLFTEKLFHRYSHLGKRNFLAYAYNAAKETYTNSENETKVGMNAPSIRKQVARHMNILINSLLLKNEQRIKLKEAKNKTVRKKKM